MGREIKFRFWDKSENEMIEETAFLSEYIESNNKNGTMVAMQFTGLKDKNGVDIYDGDVVKHNGTIRQNTLVVEFLDSAFCIGKDGIRKNKFCSFTTIRDCMRSAEDRGIELELEVIGNIHQNPELL